MNRTIVTSAFVALALLLSTSWDLTAVKILLTGCLIGWLARTVIVNFQAKKKAPARRKRTVRTRTAQHSQAGASGH